MKFLIFNIFLIIIIVIVKSQNSDNIYNIQQLQNKQQQNQGDTGYQLLKKFVNLIKQNDPSIAEIETELNELLNLTYFNQQKNQIDPAKCLECKVLTKKILNWDRVKEQISNYLEISLTLLFDKYNIFTYDVAQNIMEQMVPALFYSIWNHYLNPDYLCPKFDLCKATYEEINIKEYINEILSDKPNKKQLVPQSKKTIKFMHISDTHTDSKYTIGSQTQCDEYLDCCLEQSTPKPQKESEKAKYWGSLAACDLPVRTFDQFINFLNKNIIQDIDFAIWTGDNATHQIWEQSQEINYENSKMQTKKFQDNFKIPFYPIFGNHEEYPVNIYKFFEKQEQSEFNQEFSEMWKKWIGESAADMLKEKGFYFTENIDKTLKFIALNTQACDEDNFTLINNPTDPNQMLEQLRETLYESEKQDQAVYIYSHIPVGNGCMNDWAKVFSALVDRFSYNIRGIFNGHTHDDQFGIFKSHTNPDQTVNVNWITPSLTTHSGRNPSFRIFEADSETFQILNIHQYRLDIEYWNQFTDPNTDLQFELAYSFLEEYNLQNLWDFNNLSKLRDQIGNDLDTYNKYMSNFKSGIWENKTQINKYQFCKMLPTHEEQQYCNTQNPEYNPNIIEKLSGPWIKKIK